MLGAILYNSVGYKTAFNVARHKWRMGVIKQLARMGDENIPIVVFKFHKHDFKLTIKEFQKDGKWYDVVKVMEHPDSLEVHAFDDAFETQMTSDFQALSIDKKVELWMNQK